MLGTYSFPIGVIKGLQFDDVWVPDDAHDLQFSVLATVRSEEGKRGDYVVSNLETFVLKNSFDRCIFTGGRQFGLKHHPERPIPNNLTLGILHLLRLTGQSVLHLLTYDFWMERQFHTFKAAYRKEAHHPCAGSRTLADSVTCLQVR